MVIRIILAGWILLLIGCQSEIKNAKKVGNNISKKVKEKINIADIEVGIESYIAEKTLEGDGFFHIKNGDQELRLKLVRVHTEYLSNLGPQRHFACVDLADVSGEVYDVDFFLSGDPGDMDVTETTVHKLNGKPFYSWKQRKDKTWHRVAFEGASNDLLGIIEDKDKFEFLYKSTLPDLNKNAKMWIPIAKSDDFQKIKIKSLEVPGKQQMIEDKENNNTILLLELGPEHSGQKIAIVYEVERIEKNPYSSKEPNLDKYLTSSKLVPVGGRFGDIANDIIGLKQKNDDLMQARAIYDYIIDNMNYRKDGNHGKGDAVFACDSKGGNCTEFHSFFISLARSAGIPARFAIGAAIPSDRNEGGIDGYHCWAEFYAEGKWWPVDISEANKYTALATYYFGRHPANRIELSRGRDISIEQGPNSGPMNFLAYPLLEVDGQAVSAMPSFSFKRKSK
ncbi:transglutaminase domain-containing protein [Marivirga sp. S37H4]|uniref:Transglutaminase domain-containing protein n=1 Tax=Marivirga aurantiaca TaxID=2802615 RepID=A0A934WWT3_9BACT|nr:transglutaminase-like domain-containing protein [Marivirga aurantiaca]MBK6264315.1 transglutaminase domain-containing protein [Marivirga aurantiaca]